MDGLGSWLLSQHSPTGAHPPYSRAHPPLTRVLTSCSSRYSPTAHPGAHVLLGLLIRELHLLYRYFAELPVEQPTDKPYYVAPPP